jgi:hypothetical protein
MLLAHFSQNDRVAKTQAAVINQLCYGNKPLWWLGGGGYICRAQKMCY